MLSGDLVGKKHSVLNMCISATLWSIWKLRNDFCFQGTKWKDEKVLVGKVARMLRRWTDLCKGGNVQCLEDIISRLEARSREPLRIMWAEPLGAGCSSNLKLGDASSGECGKFINL